jgi:hypothetical protein
MTGRRRSPSVPSSSALTFQLGPYLPARPLPSSSSLTFPRLASLPHHTRARSSCWACSAWRAHMWA